MTDKSIENTLSETAKAEMTENCLFGIGSSMLEGANYAEDEKEFLIYCTLNNVPLEKVLDAVFEVRGHDLIDHEVWRKSREAQKRILNTQI